MKLEIVGSDKWDARLTAYRHPEFIFRIFPAAAYNDMSKPPRRYFVYMLSNPGKMLYTGVTGDLFRPVWQHRNERGPDDISVAVAKEKQIKTWRRRWKTNLVEFENPGWLDLADGWYE